MSDVLMIIAALVIWDAVKLAIKTILGISNFLGYVEARLKDLKKGL